MCGAKHHSKLHLEPQHAKASSGSQPVSAGPSALAHFTASETAAKEMQPGGSQQLLATAIVLLESEDGVQVTARALLDSCAER